jgi:hypothetical protein
MSKAEAIKEKLAKYRELLKATIWMIMAILTGIATIGYKILSGELPAYMILYGGIGLVIVFLASLYGKNLWDTMEKLEKDLEDA